MKLFLFFVGTLVITSCTLKSSEPNNFETEPVSIKKHKTDTINDHVSEFRKQLSQKALSIIDASIQYTPDYVKIDYPNGDVPSNTGVCTDVIIRAYRKMSIDLQKEVNEDMKANFHLYPKIWGATKTDTNIDHRRVPNLQVFFKRFGKELPISENPNDYQTGAIVTWMINSRLPHIGIVTNKLSKDGKRRLIVHNVGGGQVLEDCLFKYEITGHFVYEI